MYVLGNYLGKETSLPKSAAKVQHFFDIRKRKEIFCKKIIKYAHRLAYMKKK